MKKIALFIKIIFFSSLGLCNTYAGLFDREPVSEKLKVSGSVGFIDIIDNILGFIIGLLYFMSVILAVYAGFVILTSAGEEERVKKGKNILIYVVIGIIVIFLASQLITWIIDIFSEGGAITDS